MLNLDFYYAAAKNFLCFGPDGIEIDFKKYGNIVLIEGFNYDDLGDTGKPASNGTGKSSIADIIAYAIYGKTIKKPKKLNHAVVMNNKASKGLRVEVIFDQYRIVRQRKPDKLEFWISKDHIWDDSTKVDRGQVETQKEIEDKVGISYETFVNVVVFDDTNAYSFLESDTPSKREIVENLLRLERYRTYSDVASKSKKKVENDKINLLKEYERLTLEKDVYENRIKELEGQEKSWKTKITNDMIALIGSFKNKQAELAGLDNGKEILRYNEAQVELQALNSELLKIDSERKVTNERIEEIVKIIGELKEEYENLNISSHKEQIETYKNKINAKRYQISEIKSLTPDLDCDKCYGKIDLKNSEKVLRQNDADILDLEGEMQSEAEIMNNKISKRDKIKEVVEKSALQIKESESKNTKLLNREKEVRSKILTLSKIKQPETDTQQAVLEEQITQLRQQIDNKKVELDGPSPYEEIKKTAEKEHGEKIKECGKKKIEIEEVDGLLPYYSFWVKAFGDKGIRKFVIDGIIPALNSQTAYWLQILINGNIHLSFNNQLEEEIKRVPYDDNPFVYFAMSGGERQRLNLSVSHAFAHIMMLNSGVCPSILFLDEVTKNIDQNGVFGIYNMIFELAKTRQIFVTTHDKNLLDMLDGIETMRLEKRDGFTKIIT